MPNSMIEAITLCYLDSPLIRIPGKYVDCRINHTTKSINPRAYVPITITLSKTLDDMVNPRRSILTDNTNPNNQNINIEESLFDQLSKRKSLYNVIIRYVNGQSSDHRVITDSVKIHKSSDILTLILNTNSRLE